MSADLQASSRELPPSESRPKNSTSLFAVDHWRANFALSPRPKSQSGQSHDYALKWQTTVDPNILHQGLPQDNQPIRDPSMEYVIDLDPIHQVLRVTVTGIVTDPASLEMYASMSHFAAAGGPYAGILDLSGVTGNQLSIETIREVAQKPPAVPVGRPRVVVAPRPEDYGVVRMFESFRGEMGAQFHLVLSLDEAYLTLGVTPEDFSQRLFQKSWQPEMAELPSSSRR